MIFTADQFVAHLVGDYILQSHWMAMQKTKQSFAAAVHAVCYTLPFLLITHDPTALAIIVGTHFVIDRWRLARFVVWLKNWPFAMVSGHRPGTSCGPWMRRSDDRADRFCGKCGVQRGTPCMARRYGVKPLTATGYQDDVPAWLSVWLLIITDNTLHLICNGLAIWWTA